MNSVCNFKSPHLEFNQLSDESRDDIRHLAAILDCASALSAVLRRSHIEKEFCIKEIDVLADDSLPDLLCFGFDIAKGLEKKLARMGALGGESFHTAGAAR